MRLCSSRVLEDDRTVKGGVIYGMARFAGYKPLDQRVYIGVGEDCALEERDPLSGTVFGPLSKRGHSVQYRWLPTPRLFVFGRKGGTNNPPSESVIPSGTSSLINYAKGSSRWRNFFLQNKQLLSRKSIGTVTQKSPIWGRYVGQAAPSPDDVSAFVSLHPLSGSLEDAPQCFAAGSCSPGGAQRNPPAPQGLG
jgi:hypothetical protein